MRFAPLALLLLLAAPARAQDPVPDTTEAWRYFPLAVGNAWEYKASGEFDNYYDRWVIPRDTMIGGVRYSVREEYRSSSDDTSWELRRTSLLRFDTLSTQVVRWTGSGEIFETCPFGAGFNDIVECYRFEGDTNFVAGDYVEGVEIGGDTAPALAEKSFYLKLPVDGDVPVYVAPFGFHHVSFWICTLCHYDLTYTRLVQDDGTVVEYGSPAPVADEPSPVVPDAFALSVYPNPFVGPVTLDLAVPVPQAVTVEVFDALGRRVYAEARAVGGAARLRLDGTRWAPGVYVARVTAEDGTRATARLVRR